MSDNIPFSVIILTYNRPELLDKQLNMLSVVKYRPLDVIVVDNKSEQSVTHIVSKYPFARLIRMQANIGVAARNRGIEAAAGDILITLDDDISGINDEDIRTLIRLYEHDTALGAVCFKVLDEETGDIVNWCHHYKQEEFCDKRFITDEITEGAVAFRRDVIMQAGLYPEEFFISHEGPELALRIMNCGYKVIYTPEISVLHNHSQLGRTNWRRYYFDTRNLIWLILRNYPLFLGIKRLSIGLGAMAIYSLRDGYTRYWIKGVYDGIRGGKKALEQRCPLMPATRTILKEIDKHRPGFWYMLNKRLFKRKVRI